VRSTYQISCSAVWGAKPSPGNYVHGRRRLVHDAWRLVGSGLVYGLLNLLRIEEAAASGLAALSVVATTSVGCIRPATRCCLPRCMGVAVRLPSSLTSSVSECASSVLRSYAYLSIVVVVRSGAADRKAAQTVFQRCR